MLRFFTFACVLASLTGAFSVKPARSQDSVMPADAASKLASLKMRFIYDGTPPERAFVDVDKDVEFCGRAPLVDEHLLVHPANHGIRNVVVYVYTDRGGSTLAKTAPVPQERKLAIDRCRFDPHILIAQSGDTLLITNPDPVGHNVNISFFNNSPPASYRPPRAPQTYQLLKPEPAPMPIECNIHPWMKAYLVVLDHPFAAVSNEDGVLRIEGLPVGTLIFRASHEAGSISDVTVEGKDETWERSRFEVDLKSGMNDLGRVEIPANSFKRH